MPKRKPQQRVQRKREQERAERKRRDRMRKIRIWATVGTAVALGLVLFFVFRSTGKTTPTADRSNTASPSASGTPTGGKACTGPAPSAYKGKTYTAYPKQVVDNNKKYQVTMTTSCGDIKMTLDPKLAPKAVNNFVFLAQEGFYDNTKIHRIVNNPAGEAIMQGGDPKGDGTGGPGYNFTIEKPKAGTEYLAGTLAMANSGGTDTNGSQFFIVIHDWKGLPNNYTVFGHADVTGASKTTLESLINVPGNPLPNGLGTGPQPPIYILKVTVKAV